MTGYELCGTRNQCAENESDVLQQQLDAPLKVAGERLECVKSVLLYGSECWQVFETDLHKFDLHKY